MAGGGGRGVKTNLLSLKSNQKCYTTYVLRRTVFEVSNNNFYNGFTPIGVEGDHLETVCGPLLVLWIQFIFKE